MLRELVDPLSDGRRIRLGRLTEPRPAAGLSETLPAGRYTASGSGRLDAPDDGEADEPEPPECTTDSYWRGSSPGDSVPRSGNPGVVLTDSILYVGPLDMRIDPVEPDDGFVLSGAILYVGSPDELVDVFGVLAGLP